MRLSHRVISGVVSSWTRPWATRAAKERWRVARDRTMRVMPPTARHAVMTSKASKIQGLMTRLPGFEDQRSGVRWLS